MSSSRTLGCYCFRTSSLTEPWTRAHALINEPHGSPHCPPPPHPQPWGYRPACGTWLFRGCWRLELRSLYLRGRHLHGCAVPQTFYICTVTVTMFSLLFWHWLPGYLTALRASFLAISSQIPHAESPKEPEVCSMSEVSCISGVTGSRSAAMRSPTSKGFEGGEGVELHTVEEGWQSWNCLSEASFRRPGLEWMVVWGGGTMTLGMGMERHVLVLGRDPHRRMTSPTLNKLGLETLTDGVTYCYKWFLSYFIIVYTFLQYFKQ